MRITYVKTIGFRKFKDVFETKLYDTTSITGANRKGKSNLLYAIVSILMGTNLTGDDRACLINKNSNAYYGELHFIDNQNVDHILIRSKDKYLNKNNFQTLDGKMIAQEDLIDFYQDKKLFLSIINLSYFLSKKPVEQKELINKYLPNIEVQGVYDKLDDHDKKVLSIVPTNFQDYIKELNDGTNFLENKNATLHGKIEYAQNIVNEKLESKNEFEKEEELSFARQEVSFLKNNDVIVDKEKQKDIVQTIEDDILKLENEITELDTLMKTGKKQYLSIKSEDNCFCPMCEQKLQNENKLKALTKMREELVSYYSKKNTLDTKLKDVKLKLATERCKYHALDGDDTVEKSKKIANLEENIKALELEQQEIQKHNEIITIKENNIKSAKQDISNFIQEIKENEKCIEEIKQEKQVVQKLYINYIEEKMKFATKYLKDVKIRFYSVLKGTGEIKEDFIITYKNNELANLSRSETVATSLEIANMFNKISGANIPLFIDDTESCADYDFISQYGKNNQLILAKVEKGTPLTVTDYKTGENTVFKQTIKSCKTLKLQKTIKDNIQKQAA